MKTVFVAIAIGVFFIGLAFGIVAGGSKESAIGAAVFGVVAIAAGWLKGSEIESNDNFEP